MSTPVFNRTNDLVDWARYTWNPVTGCFMDCQYCYARDIANRFYPEKFVPTFHPDRLAAPRNTRLPRSVKLLTDPREITAWMNAFLCSMADLYGPWVPDEWLNLIFQACRENPQWNYLTLSKYPHRYVGLDFPPHFWVGTTVDCQARVHNAERAFAQINHPNVVTKWLSLEPLLEPLRFTDLSLWDWVVLGGASRSTKTPEFFPPDAWVEDLIDQAHQAGCKVYCKPNLDPNGYWAHECREYPDAFDQVFRRSNYEQ